MSHHVPGRYLLHGRQCRRRYHLRPRRIRLVGHRRASPSAHPHGRRTVASKVTFSSENLDDGREGQIGVARAVYPTISVKALEFLHAASTHQCGRQET